MSGVFIKIFEFFSRRRRLYVATLLVLFAVLAVKTLSLDYSEDINDFLPLDKNHQKSLAIYQNISSSDKVIVIFEQDTINPDPDYTVEAINFFNEELTNRDTLNYFSEPVQQYDYSTISRITDVVYDNIPFCLGMADYDRLDTLITEEFVARQIGENKKFLMMPSSSFMTASLRRDPLNLFLPVIQSLQGFAGESDYQIYDGYIFSPDLKIAIGMLTSPFGGSETNNNTRLIKFLNDVVADVQSEYEGVSIHITGAPAIAVGNATQIKRDSFLAIALSIILILAILLYSFRSFKTVLLISLSIFFGWLFAMAGISVISKDVSMIVLGIASVIIGIAVNYPLHLIAHLNHTPSIKESLKEIVSPLIIGNVTTVGAFLALVPMDSVALRDLGIFSSLMLVGSIIFVLVFLPPMLKNRGGSKEHYLFPALSKLSFDSKGWIIVPLLLLTLVFGYFCRYTYFNVDMQSINYMTDEQRADFKKLNLLTNPGGYTQLYVVSEGANMDEAIRASEKFNGTLLENSVAFDSIGVKSITALIPSLRTQQMKLERWNRLIEEKSEILDGVLKDELMKNGFKLKAFSPFFNTIEKEYSCGELSELYNLEMFDNYISRDSSCMAVVDILSVPDSLVNDTKRLLEGNGSSFFFDVKSLNNRISQTLSDEFDYICYACGVIVFIFLWLSFGRLELSILAFLPMAISWIWILGLMGIFGIEFNIVNIILATFIFGQGDDYTIFITEGIIHEYTYKKKILASYKNSIIMSAFIMFAGIGTLILAKHPALRSLAEVTIVGMTTVVIISHIVPNIVFRFLTYKGAQPRMAPLTIAHFVRAAASLPLMLVWRISGGNARHLVSSLLIKLLVGVKVKFNGKPSGRNRVVICNAVSVFDRVVVDALYNSPVLVVANNGEEFSKAFDEAVSIARRCSSGIDLMHICGSDHIAPEGTLFINGGVAFVEVLPVESFEIDNCVGEAADKWKAMASAYAPVEVYKDYVVSKYVYKGHTFEKRVRSRVEKSECFREILASVQDSGDILVKNSGLGELALFAAKVYPDRRVCLYETDREIMELVSNLSHLPDNLIFVDSESEYEKLVSSGSVTLI